MKGYRTKVDIIYEILMEKIATRKYEAGDRLVISQISKENNVSDIPVREAIRRLESEGYVQIVANQGAVVCSFSKERIQEIFQIKAVLEGYAARLSIDYLTPKDLEELRSYNQKMHLAMEENDVNRYSQLNVEFHLRIYQNLPQKEMYNIIQDLWKKYSITKSVFSLSPKSMETSIAEHEEILRLIEQKEYDTVESYMRSHKMRASIDLTHELEYREKLTEVY